MALYIEEQPVAKVIHIIILIKLVGVASFGIIK